MTAPILTTILFAPLILLILSGRGDNLKFDDNPVVVIVEP